MARGNGNGRKVATLDELLALPLPTQDVELPEYGAKVTLTAITGQQRATLLGLSSAANESREAQVAWSHELIATAMGAEADDVAKLSASAIDRLLKATMSLVGIGEEAVTAAVDSLKGTPSGDSG